MRFAPLLYEKLSALSLASGRTRQEVIRTVLEDVLLRGEAHVSVPVSACDAGRRVIKVTLPPAVYEAAQAHAQGRALRLATWLRYLVVSQVSRVEPWSRAEAHTLGGLHGELGRVGNNIYQIARALNVDAADGSAGLAGELGALRDALGGVQEEIQRTLSANQVYWRRGRVRADDSDV